MSLLPFTLGMLLVVQPAGVNVTRKIDLQASVVTPIQLVRVQRLARRDSRGILELVLVASRDVPGYGSGGIIGHIRRITELIHQAGEPDLSQLSNDDAQLVRQMRALRERLRRESGAEVEIQMRFEVRADGGSAFPAQGFRRAFETDVQQPGGPVHVTGYMRSLPAGDALYGEARARVEIAGSVRQDDVGRIRLELAEPVVRFDERDVPSSADRNVLRVMLSRFQTEVRLEVEAIVRRLQGFQLLTDPEMRPLIAGPEGRDVRIDRQVPYTWFEEPRHAAVMVAGRLGSIIFLDGLGADPGGAGGFGGGSGRPQ